MSRVTTCTKCGKLYEETCEELANAPERQCWTCFDKMIDDEFGNEDNYVEEDSERPNADPFALTEDQRLDSPQHGQGDK